MMKIASCPMCGADIPQGKTECPGCGEAIPQPSKPRTVRWRIIPTFLLGLFGTIWTIGAVVLFVNGFIYWDPVLIWSSIAQAALMSAYGPLFLLSSVLCWTKHWAWLAVTLIPSAILIFLSGQVDQWM